MNGKSYVSMEQKVCPACASVFDSGAILMDTRLKDSMEMATVTGWQLCADCEKYIDEGYVILVGALTPDKHVESMKLEDANRTGDLIFIRRDAAIQIFNIEPRDMMFIDPGAMEKIRSLLPPENNQEESNG